MRVRLERSRGAVVALGLLLPSLVAAARPTCALDVAIDPAQGTARGRVVLEIENTSGAALGAVELWRFPGRLERRSPVLNDYNFYRIYPRSFSPGGMRVAAVTVDGVAVVPTVMDAVPAGAGTILSLPLAAPLAPGGRVRIEASFDTVIPRRYGAFGCYDGACTLAGGFYPMPVALGPGGYDRGAPPARSDFSVTVRAPPGADVIVGGVTAGAGPVVLEDAPYALVTVERGLRERTLSHRGVTVHFFGHHLAQSPPLPPGKGAPYLDEDRAALVLAEAREAIELLHEIGLLPVDGTQLTLVEAPLRMELAEAHGDMVLVSDQIFRILPLDRFRKFHGFQLIRGIYGALFERRLRGRERGDDIGWSPDVGASFLVDLFTLRVYQRAEFAQDVLKWVSFIPQIDRILYAPQIPFASAYFNTLDDPDPTRDDVMRFAHLRPRGKTIYEKLRDRLGDPGTARVMRALWAGVPVREAAGAEAGSDLGEFFGQWLGPYPEVDYRYEVLGSERRGGRWHHRIRLFKRGKSPPVEPVELRVTEWGGVRHDLIWDGQGRERVLTVETARGVQSIELDPRGRLQERMAGAEEDLRFDNRRPARLKFIYNNFGALLNVGELAFFQNLKLDLSLDFTLNRILDVKNGTRFVLFRSQSTQIGLSGSYARHFGRMITPARLSSGASVSTTLSRLEPTFGRVGEPSLPTTRITVGTGVGYDDRIYAWEPLLATSFGLSASYTLTVEDAGRARQQATFSASAQRIQPLADGHGLAFEGGAAVTVGDLGVPSQMLSAGAPGWLRGYGVDELLGRLRVAARAEYRHVFVHDLNWNLLHTLFVHGISGGLFVEAAMISPCEGYGVGTKDLFADVGYSLRIIEDWFGVGQTVFNIDVAVPLVRRTRSCFPVPGESPREPSTRTPLGFFVYYGPIW
ncbi:MAG: hypothetical protein EXR72_09060 [Myxococcales bacterium]|nr:hypothetical protein [Myxococcales bacterium]